MKLRTQIFVGYAQLAVLVVVVGLTGYVSVRLISQSFDSAINQTQPVLTALQKIRLQATTLAFSVSTANAAAKEGTQEHAGTAPSVAELMTSVAEYQGLVGKYFPLEIEEAKEIKAHAEVFARAIASIGDHNRSGDHKNFHEQQSQLSEALEGLMEATTEAAEGEEQEFHELQATIHAKSADHLLAIVLTSVLSLLLVILGGAALAGRIARPVAALRLAALRFGQGHLGERVEVHSQNEIGELAQAFNQMASELSTSLVTRDYVESIIESLAEGVVVLNDAGRIERVNGAMRSICHESALGELAGLSLNEVFVANGDIDVMTANLQTSQGIEASLRGNKIPPTLVTLSASSIPLGNGKKGRVLLVQDVTDRRMHEDRLRYLASYDVLTGLPNRRMFLGHLRNSLARLPWKNQHVGVLFCDIDRFKFVNDSLGHSVGDVLLQRIADRMREVLRPGDVIGRWAGDEFVVLLEDIADAAHVDVIAAKIVSRVRDSVQVGPHELHVSMSVGIACAPGDGLDADDLIKDADLAMYAAKEAGKNQCRRYQPIMRERTVLRLQLEHALRSAIDTPDQLKVHYQAQQNVDGTLIGFEALVRWQHPELGLISPAQFLPAAEEAGLMAALDESVMGMAFAQLRNLHEAGWPDLRMAVNLSNQTFQRKDLVQMVARVIDASGLARDAVELELTEEVVMENVGTAVGTMEQLCALGVQLSIDDFGTGYSSLSQLKRCPISMLKIDRSFITEVTQDAGDRAITDAIIALSHKLGVLVIAEGVETQAQFDLLRQSGCDAVQGYLLSKPLPHDQVLPWLKAFQPLR